MAAIDSRSDQSTPHSRLASVAFPAVLFAASAAALVVEIVAGRLLAPYVGMSLYTWTAIIAVVLAGLSAGHWLGGRLDPGDRRRTQLLLAGVFAGAALTTAIAPVLLRVVAIELLVSAGSPLLGITLLSGALFFTPSLFVGMVSPIVTRVAIDDAGASTSRVLGRMFAAGALGSIAGTLLAGFVFIAWLGSTATLIGVALLHLILAACFFFVTAPKRRTIVTTLGIAGVLAVLTAASGHTTNAFDRPCTHESSYFCIRVLDQSFETERASRLMVLDHMGHGINDRDEPRWLHSSYVALSDRLVRWRGLDARGPRAFFIGGGAYTLPRAWLASFPNARLTVAELDPMVTQTAFDAMWLTPSPRLQVVHEDARVALARTVDSPPFDVIIGDAFKDLAVPAHLVTVEFAALVRARLATGGVYLLTVIDEPAAPRFLAATVRTLERAFPAVEVWVDERQFTAQARSTFLVLAADTASPSHRLVGASPDDVADARRWRRLAPDALRTANVGDPAVLTDDHAPVDRLMLDAMERSR